MNFFQELIKRYSLESPKFFKKIDKFGVWVFRVGVLIASPIAIPESVVDVSKYVPAVFSKAGAIMILSGFLISAIARITVENPEDITRDMPAK